MTKPVRLMSLMKKPSRMPMTTIGRSLKKSKRRILRSSRRDTLGQKRKMKTLWPIIIPTKGMWQSFLRGYHARRTVIENAWLSRCRDWSRQARSRSMRHLPLRRTKWRNWEMRASRQKNWIRTEMHLLTCRTRYWQNIKILTRTLFSMD